MAEQERTLHYPAAFYENDQNVVSVVGEDFPKEMLELLSSRNVNLDGLQIIKGEKTFFWSGKYHNDMNSRDTLITELNVLEKFDPIIPASYQDTDFFDVGES